MYLYKRSISILKKILSILLVAVAVYSLERFCHKETDGFTVTKIRKSFPLNNPSAPLSNLEAITSILEQHFSYLGRGGQCYAFVSEDGQYILKLLKYNNHYPRIWFRLLPFPFGLEKYRQAKLANKQSRLKAEYTSYEIAEKDLKEETGIVYFHLYQDTLPTRSLHITDKLGIHHLLKTDEYQFYIQKKGMPFYAGLQKLFLEKGEVAVENVLDSFVEYLFARCKKNISDGDTGIRRNFALNGEIPFQIDIGQFSYDPSFISLEAQTNHILFFTRGFHKWLEQLSPSLAEHLFKQIENHKESCEKPL